MYTLKDWRRGRRKAPQWAIDRLIQHAQEHANKTNALVDMLRKVKGRG